MSGVATPFVIMTKWSMVFMYALSTVMRKAGMHTLNKRQQYRPQQHTGCKSWIRRASYTIFSHVYQ